jgi:hypothetical protein
LAEVGGECIIVGEQVIRKRVYFVIVAGVRGRRKTRWRALAGHVRGVRTVVAGRVWGIGGK